MYVHSFFFQLVHMYVWGGIGQNRIPKSLATCVAETPDFTLSIASSFSFMVYDLRFFEELSIFFSQSILA